MKALLTSTLVLLKLLVLISSCQSEEKTVTAPASIDGVSSPAMPKGEDFNLEKEDDESCDTKEDLEKKLEEAKKKPNEAFKLQGGDAGCEV